MTRSALALVLVGALAKDAGAGIQNVQSALADEPDEGVSGTATASVDWRTGNTSFLFIAVNAALRLRSGKHLGIVLVKGERKSNGESILVSRTFEHARYRYLWSDRWLGEAFLQHEFDGVKRVNIRAIAGAGPRLTLFDDDKLRAGVGVAYMLEYERLQDDSQMDAGATDVAHRVSTYLVGSFAAAERIQIVETFYAQPSLTNASDYRLLSESSIVVKATDRVSFSTALTIAHDSAPPDTIEKTDTSLISSITVEL